LLRYANVREGAICSLIGILSDEILEQAGISDSAIAAIKAKESRSGFERTLSALSSPIRGMRGYFQGPSRSPALTGPPPSER
jgi:hypothetical protein